MTWAQRLARVFRIDVTRCEYCGGPVRILARLKDPAVRGRYRQITVGIRTCGLDFTRCVTATLCG
jgi:hypothetical protein